MSLSASPSLFDNRTATKIVAGLVVALLIYTGVTAGVKSKYFVNSDMQVLSLIISLIVFAFFNTRIMGHVMQKVGGSYLMHALVYTAILFGLISAVIAIYRKYLVGLLTKVGLKSTLTDIDNNMSPAGQVMGTAAVVTLAVVLVFNKFTFSALRGLLKKVTGSSPSKEYKNSLLGVLIQDLIILVLIYLVVAPSIALAATSILPWVDINWDRFENRVLENKNEPSKLNDSNGSTNGSVDHPFQSTF